MGFDNWGDILCHHGIKGMKWGIRRYQNADGTLTEEGRNRYFTEGHLNRKGQRALKGQIKKKYRTLRTTDVRSQAMDLAKYTARAAAGAAAGVYAFKQGAKDIETYRSPEAGLPWAVAGIAASGFAAANTVLARRAQKRIGYVGHSLAVEKAKKVVQKLDTTISELKMEDLKRT